MATVLLSAAGAAIGSSVGGTFAGIAMTAVGRFVGASIGQAIDNRLMSQVMGSGSRSVETGKVSRFHLNSVGEGVGIAKAFGRMRVGGQVIWATHFKEHVTTRREEASGGGGKGGGGSRKSEVKITEYRYSISLALALCEGEITHVPRVWLDGNEVATSSLNMRIYKGRWDQMPDPKIEAVEGVGNVPAYRGIAYVVIEDLDITSYGNRVPQFNFEVTAPVPSRKAHLDPEVAHAVKAVALLPGSGEYVYATRPIYFDHGGGNSGVANLNSPSGQADFNTALSMLEEELPQCKSSSLIVSWFGTDLRCGDCEIHPRVEQKKADARDMPWQVSGLTRSQAGLVPQDDGRPVYGGTPTDQSVIEAIKALHAKGQRVMYYPFILMEQLSGNDLPNPYTGESGQPHLPWRGRITASIAPGRDGSPDKSAAILPEIAKFFGNVKASDFSIENGEIVYSGPDEWNFSRFMLHNAALCRAAGGVDAFCIGSEMRALTQLRSSRTDFPAVEALMLLVKEVRALLGTDVKLGYAADWSEYFGYHPQDGSGDLFFHLDPLWAAPEIDFIGIDNYMPLSDWRDGWEHADQEWGSIYNLDYLRANIEGGEGYDWYYSSQEGRDAQRRVPISDEKYNEPWVWRYKDIRNWWSEAHFNRIGGERSNASTPWDPRSKPIWFTELGCAAVERGTNQPNKFVDPKSSETALPYYSNGQRDEFIQMQYLRAMYSYWSDPAKNPISAFYHAPMIDMSRAFVWAWDARPYPWFPNRTESWSDGPNYRLGHWISGRVSGRSLASVVAELCERSGLYDYDVSELYGFVRGFLVEELTTARSALQGLMLRYGFDAVERGGKLVFVMRNMVRPTSLDPNYFAISDESEAITELTRGAEAELSGRVRVEFIEADANYEIASEEAILPDEATHAISQNALALAMTRAEGRQTAERWLTEARIARDKIAFALPPSRMNVQPGEIVQIPQNGTEIQYRIDRKDFGPYQLLEGVRVETHANSHSILKEVTPKLRSFSPPLPVLPLFMDLPLMTGEENPYAPHVAVTSAPWSGPVALYSSQSNDSFALNQVLGARAIVGVTQNDLLAAGAGRFDPGPGLRVKLTSGTLENIGIEALLGGSNLAAIGDPSGGEWELFQFSRAELVAQDTYILHQRLRGQLGTDGSAPRNWPKGSYFVKINGAVSQIDLKPIERRLNRNYRIGPASQNYDDPSYSEQAHVFHGNGLRPLSPVHLRNVRDADGIHLSWIRRSRVDADSWDLEDIPLGEEREAYQIIILADGQEIHRAKTTLPAYSLPQEIADQFGKFKTITCAVAQISNLFGAGSYASLSL